MHQARGRTGARAQTLLGDSKAILRGGARTGKAGLVRRRWGGQAGMTVHAGPSVCREVASRDPRLGWLGGTADVRAG